MSENTGISTVLRVRCYLWKSLESFFLNDDSLGSIDSSYLSKDCNQLNFNKTLNKRP